MRACSSTARFGVPRSSEMGPMADDEREDLPATDAAERFDGYLEALLGDGRPSPEEVGDGDEAEVARTAVELAGTGASAAGGTPDPAVLEQLRLRMREA